MGNEASPSDVLSILSYSLSIASLVLFMAGRSDAGMFSPEEKKRRIHPSAAVHVTAKESLPKQVSLIRYAISASGCQYFSLKLWQIMLPARQHTTVGVILL